MAILKRAVVYVLSAAALTQSAAFVTPQGSAPASHVHLMASTDDAAVDMQTREARILAPLSAVLTASLSLGYAGPANAAPVFDSNMRKNFPGAMSNSAIALRVASTLKERGYTPSNTLFGNSLCSDEINDTSESLVNDFQNKLQVGGVFNLGGLGGLPFVGVSGMGAFLSHCPDSGKVFIVFGPHVGVSKDGVVGKVERIGRKGPSTSCGAGIGAYKAIIGDSSGEDKSFLGTKDFQEDYIIAKLRDRLDPVKDQEVSNESITFVTNKMYDLVWEMLRSQVNSFTNKPGFWDGVSEVTLLGGIVVNRGHGADGIPGGEDFYQPLMLKSLTKEGESDIYGEVFGDFPALAAPHRAAKYV